MASIEREGVHFIREVSVRYVGQSRRAPSAIRQPQHVADYMCRVVQDDAREHFLALYLDGRHRPLAHQVVSVGTATASLVHPREVFQPAVLVGACALVIGHNHPSGDPRPSQEDRDVTRRLVQAGRILGIHLLDSLVWVSSNGFWSASESEPELLE